MKPLVQTRTRFNLFDALIVFMLLALVVGLAVYLVPRHSGGEEGTLTLTFTSVRAPIAALLQKGDIVYDQSGSNTLGTIVDISSKRDQLSLTDPATGENRRALYPENTFLEVTITLQVKNATRLPSEEGLTLPSLVIRCGDAISVRTARAALDGVCTEVAIKGEKL